MYFSLSCLLSRSLLFNPHTTISLCSSLVLSCPNHSTISRPSPSLLSLDCWLSPCSLSPFADSSCSYALSDRTGWLPAAVAYPVILPTSRPGCSVAPIAVVWRGETPPGGAPLPGLKRGSVRRELDCRGLLLPLSDLFAVPAPGLLWFRFF